MSNNDLLGRRRIVARLLPKGAVGAEIGVFKGDFSQSILDVLQPKRLYLIDPWEVSDSPKFDESLYGRKSQNNMPAIMASVLERFDEQLKSGRVKVLHGTSEAGLAKLEDDSLDFAYVDGDHSYEGVKDDLTICFRKVRAGGVIALDDYGVNGWWKDGIVRAAHEFLGEFTSRLEIKGCGNGQLIIQRLS